jgi:hypothetical protein
MSDLAQEVAGLDNDELEARRHMAAAALREGVSLAALVAVIETELEARVSVTLRGSDVGFLCRQFGAARRRAIAELSASPRPVAGRLARLRTLLENDSLLTRLVGMEASFRGHEVADLGYHLLDIENHLQGRVRQEHLAGRTTFDLARELARTQTIARYVNGAWSGDDD